MHAACYLLKLDDKNPNHLFEGIAFIRRLIHVGVLDETKMRLDYVLALKIEDFLECSAGCRLRCSRVILQNLFTMLWF
jgi:hypothetical protein